MFKGIVGLFIGPTRQGALDANARAADVDPGFARELDGLIETLQRAANSKDRGYTAERIGARGRAAAKAVLILLDMLRKDPGEDARTGVAGALGDIGVGTAEVVCALIEAIRRDKNADVRLNAIISLGQLGPNAKTAIPLLKSLASDSQESDEIRFRAGINAKILEHE